MKASFVSVTMPPSIDGYFKTRESRLFSALGGKWNRRRGYHTSPKRAELWRQMVASGWDAGYKGLTENHRLFESPTGERMGIREAINHAKHPLKT